MELEKALVALASPPEPEAPGTDSIWTDPYVSRELLEVHLDPSTDAASRRPAARAAVLRWIGSCLEARRGPAGASSPGTASVGARLLDLGCGPGLYAEALAGAGHSVVGIDMNPASLAYARASAERAGLEIDYRLGSYLELDYPGGLDAAFMIFCDFGALDDRGRRTVLRKLRRSLALGGLFLFDVCGPGAAGSYRPGRSWSVEEEGFWGPGRQLVLEEQFLFPEARSLTRQYLVVDTEGKARLFRNHDTWFDEPGLAALLGSEGFELVELRRDLLPPSDFSTDDVLFALARICDPGGGRRT